MSEPQTKIILNKGSWFHNSGSLLSEIRYRNGDPVEIALRDSIGHIVFSGLMDLGWMFIVIFITLQYDSSGDPYTVIFPTIGIMVCGIFVYRIVERIGQLIYPTKRGKLIVYDEGIIDNDLFIEWKNIDDVRIKMTRENSGTVYEIMILQKNSFLETQGISNFVSEFRDEPEYFYYLRKVIDYYSNQKNA